MKAESPSVQSYHTLSSSGLLRSVICPHGSQVCGAVMSRTNLLIHWNGPWRWERLKEEGEEGYRRWDGWMASLTQWTWTWANSRRQWRTGKPGVSMVSQRVRYELATGQQQPRTKMVTSHPVEIPFLWKGKNPRKSVGLAFGVKKWVKFSLDFPNVLWFNLLDKWVVWGFSCKLTNFAPSINFHREMVFILYQFQVATKV